MASNNHKPYQTNQIRKSGFAVPETVVTTDPNAVLDFWQRHGAVIYKSNSGVRSIVARLPDMHRERLGNVAWCPTQFQQYIPGVDHRVPSFKTAFLPPRFAQRPAMSLTRVTGTRPATVLRSRSARAHYPAT